MRLRKLFRQYVEESDKDLKESYDNIAKDFKRVNERIDGWAKVHNALNVTVKNLLEELATNGVIRDIRALQKEFKEFREFKMNATVLLTHLDDANTNLQNNGVATAINNLQLEVFGKKKAGKSVFGSASMLRALSGDDNIVPDEATLAGKVDAIIEHLGLDVSVKPEEKIAAKVVAKKKPIAKKRRRY